MKKLFLIPARGGSKGLPGKNLHPLAGRPLIFYTLDAAVKSKGENDTICVSTDDEEIKSAVESYGIPVPFLRPKSIATDTSSSQEVIDHALEWYGSRGVKFDLLVLLQPTSPLRSEKHISEALTLLDNEVEMIVSVKKSSANPYYNLFEEDNTGYLIKSKPTTYTRRQEAPPVFQYNGAIYIFNQRLSAGKTLSHLSRIRKYLMSKKYSVDIDDIYDLKLAEFILKDSS